MVDIEKAIKELLEDLVLPPDILATGKGENPRNVTGRLEHSLLTAGLTLEALREECRMARDLRIAVVCVAPYYVAEAVSFLAGSEVLVCAAVGFPGAFISTQAKAADVQACVMLGAKQVDVAINIAAIKSGCFFEAENDFLSAVRAAGERADVKAVFEHGSYDDAEKRAVLEMIGRSGVPFVKIQNMTSGHGARVEDIQLVRSVLGDRIKIKIDGGVKTLAQARELLESGANRIGLTATMAVAEEERKEGKPEWTK